MKNADLFRLYCFRLTVPAAAKYARDCWMDIEDTVDFYLLPSERLAIKAAVDEIKSI